MNLQIGVKALIQNPKNEYLFMHRSKPRNIEKETLWDIPGGRIEPEEALLDALRREIKEETGIKITSNPQLICVQDIFDPTKNRHVVRITYSLDGDGDVVISDEHQQTSWMTINDALNSKLDPYTREALMLQKNA